MEPIGVIAAINNLRQEAEYKFTVNEDGLYPSEYLLENFIQMERTIQKFKGIKLRFSKNCTDWAVDLKLHSMD
eukprot:snap_masked-scaffold_7-processed-gene-18.18-mRNA-1 protein AED:1.00 eAED:1.00 QI:0/-1/0/0/-1/1/1/0/72